MPRCAVPLLEPQKAFPGFLFRYKSTFTTTNERATPVVDFVNRIVGRLAGDEAGCVHRDVSLKPGEVLLRLNGACVQVDREVPRGGDRCLYPVWGPATLHGRKALCVTRGQVERTFIRGNMVMEHRCPAGPVESPDGPQRRAPVRPLAAIVDSFGGKAECTVCCDWAIAPNNLKR